MWAFNCSNARAQEYCSSKNGDMHVGCRRGKDAKEAMKNSSKYIGSMSAEQPWAIMRLPILAFAN